jgi:hypothetical protein
MLRGISLLCSRLRRYLLVIGLQISFLSGYSDDEKLQIAIAVICE